MALVALSHSGRTNASNQVRVEAWCLGLARNRDWSDTLKQFEQTSRFVVFRGSCRHSWGWVKTYEITTCGGMMIHSPAILGYHRGDRVLTKIAILKINMPQTQPFSDLVACSYSSTIPGKGKPWSWRRRSSFASTRPGSKFLLRPEGSNNPRRSFPERDIRKQGPPRKEEGKRRTKKENRGKKKEQRSEESRPGRSRTFKLCISARMAI